MVRLDADLPTRSEPLEFPLRFAYPRLESRPLASLLAVGLLLVAVGCPKTAPPPQPTPDDTPAEPNVVIDSLSPDQTREGRAVTVTVMGKGFEDGAKVFLNSRSMGGVDVYDDGELTFRAGEDLPAGRYDVQIELPNGDDAVLRGAFTVQAKPQESGDCTLETVLFEFNEAGLGSGARDAIAAAARCIEARGLKKVRLEGHADERGSTEYNLSLGQRRAESVRNYLVGLGISESRLDTLTYGEERPADRGHDEAAWRKNRRVEFAVP